jgi:sortase A
MADVNGPLLVRRNQPIYFFKPGIHNYNARRRIHQLSIGIKILRGLQLLFLLLGMSALGYYGYSLSDQYVYQAYENWAFDQAIAGRPVTLADYLREKTPFGSLVRTNTQAGIKPEVTPQATAVHPAEGSLLGRVEISRLHLSAIVREGVDAKTLSTAVGHVPSTVMPGQFGNFAIVAHRDTLFRALKDIKQNDLVTFQSASGTYTYEVAATKIVKPSDVSVLRPDGGGLLSADKPAKLLTMITCYPFYYVGSAPKRFIVEAKLVSE